MGELNLSAKQKRIVGIISFAVFIVFFLVLAWAIGKPMLEFVSEPEKFREWIDTHGIWGRVAFVGMTVLQIVIAIIPGEPLEMVAGYAFGGFEGTILCIIANIIGGVIIFALVRTWGVKFVELFFSRKKILSLKFLKDKRKLNILVYLLFILPGTPKDLLSYFAGLTNISWGAWLFITSVARIPSIITSTLLGGALGTQKYKLAIIVLIATLIVSGIGWLIYNLLCNYFNKRKANNSNQSNQCITTKY